METLEFIKRSEDGKIIIELPQDFKGKDLRITVTEAIGEETGNTTESASNKKVINLMKYYGTAKFPDIDLDKYNVYEQ